MKPVADAKPAAEPADETVRSPRQCRGAHCAHARGLRQCHSGLARFTDGALYQVYAAVGRVTMIALQPGEELVTVAAGDTVRWIVGDTSSGSGDALRQCDGEAHPFGPEDQSRHHVAAGRTCWS